MDKYNVEFIGSSCGEHGPYTFYKSFKYCKDGIWKVLNLGEFFYVRTSRTAPICIAELQLLWNDKGNGNQLLSSCRLYYLPEHIPNGRTQFHGQDEVVANHNKVVLKLHDLLQWICEDLIWPNGTDTLCYEKHSTKEDCSQLWISSGLNFQEVKKCKLEIETKETQERPRVHIVSYPKYCRYKAVLKRIENTPERMLTDSYVTVLGGIVMPYKNTKLLFCRDTTDIPSLINHNKICDELAPNLKGRPRKKRTLTKGSSVDEDYEPVFNGNSSKENDINKVKKRLLKVKDRRIRPKVKITPRINKVNEEAMFLADLKKFMNVEKKPIDRIPHLGFKQIDLFLFYNEVKKLGGYDAVCDQRKWKVMYDVLGGNPGSTSAATCTRRHYERLLLAYERHVKGDLVITPTQKQKKLSCSRETPKLSMSIDIQKQDETKTQIVTDTQTQNKTQIQTKIETLKPVVKPIQRPAKPKVKRPRAKMLKDHVREMEERKRLEALKAQQLAFLQNNKPVSQNNMAIVQVKSESQAIAITPVQASMQLQNTPALALAAASAPEKTETSIISQPSYPILKCMSPTPLFATIKQEGQAATVHTIPNPGIQFINAFQPVKHEVDKPISAANVSGKSQATTSRASVIQHTHKKEELSDKPGMVQQCDLILRQKATSQIKVENESKDCPSKPQVVSSSPEDTIIITPRLISPMLYMHPQMMLTPNQQIALMQNNCTQMLQSQYNHPQFRMDTDKHTAHVRNGSVANHVYSVPEQDEPCDLSLPKKRKTSETNVKLVRSTNNVHHPSNNRRNESSVRSKHSKHADRHFHKTHKYKMTPDSRGSITQGVIDSRKRPTLPNSQISPLKGAQAESSRFTMPQVPTLTFNPLTGLVEGTQNNNLVFPDIKSPLLATPMPRFISGPLMNPQLLQARHDPTATFPDYLRQRMFLPPFTSASLVTSTRVPSDAKQSPVYRA
ncbi:uncharacterized protein [Antedon mediterranea]|uniref:uncharacterized protein n=1 Tax=Antedon mediterranea TaxID=105859 RepID=UPI003AF985A9